MKLHCLLFAAVLVSGCGGTNAPPEHPVEPPRALEDAPPPSSKTEAIPQYFLVEVGGSQVTAGGEEVDLGTLRSLAIAEVNGGQVRGAALTLKDQATQEQALAVVRLLLESGFRHVVLSSRVGLTAAPSAATPPPAALPPGSNAGEMASAPPASPDVTEPAPTAAPPEGPPIEVKHMGLHIGGGPNDPEHHALYAEPISHRFEDIRQCYTLVQDNPKKASFGVDLLVPSKGGKAKIENYRTAIGGKDFHLCVLGVFGSIDFPAPGKATMVSYSVLFKPR